MKKTRIKKRKRKEQKEKEKRKIKKELREITKGRMNEGLKKKEREKLNFL